MTDTPKTSRRRRWVLLTLLLLLLGGAAIVSWINSRDALSDEERHLVGTWTYQWDAHPAKNLGLEYEYRADRTCRIRNYDPKTGALLVDSSGATWWMSGNRLIVRHPGAAAGSFWHVLPSQRAADEVSTLTPDGPDRFRFTGTIEIRSTSTQPPVTGTMTRVTSRE